MTHPIDIPREATVRPPRLLALGAGYGGIRSAT